jgi:hypothetical protein
MLAQHVRHRSTRRTSSSARRSGPNFAHAPAESIGQRWLDDAAATAWRIAVPVSAEQQR